MGFNSVFKGLNSTIQGDRTSILLSPQAEEMFVMIGSAEKVLPFNFTLAPAQSLGDF